MNEQFTGFTDKNKRKIYSGDRVAFSQHFGPVTGRVKLSGLVEWSDNWECFVVKNVRDERGIELCDRFLSDILSDIKVNALETAGRK